MNGLLVTGMHHSGTSVVTGLLAASGWHPGERLIEDDPRTGKRYFEDANLVELHRAWFGDAVPNADHPKDWGLSGPEPPAIQTVPRATEQARAFAETRRHERARWVAKDPRASLMLPMWAQVPEIGFLLVYRSPWDVVHSLIMSGAPFCDDPDWVRSAWLAHNRALLEHALQHRERCFVAATETILGDPRDFLETFSSWTGEGRHGFDFSHVIDPKLFHTRNTGSAIARLYEALYPELTDALRELDAVADLPRRPSRPARAVVVPGGSLPGDDHVHVVIPCRNDGGYLVEAVASVEAAATTEGQAVELTIVDDGSDDDGTLRVLGLLAGCGYQVVRQPARGLSAARNTGIACSHARAVIPLDSDNRIRPTILRGAQHVLSGGADVVYGRWLRFGADHSEVHPPSSIDWSSFVPNNTVDACAVVRRSLIEKVNGYDESLPTLEDWEMWMRLLSAGARFHHLDEVTFEYLVRRHSMLAWTASQPELVQGILRTFSDRYGALASSVGANFAIQGVTEVGLVREDSAVRLIEPLVPPSSSRRLFVRLRAQLRIRRRGRKLLKMTLGATNLPSARLDVSQEQPVNRTHPSHEANELR